MLKRSNRQVKLSKPQGHAAGGGRFGVMALEPRFMFDAAGMATVAETVDDPPAPDGSAHAISVADSAAVVAADSPAAQTPSAQDAAPGAPEPLEGPAAPAARNVVFVDTTVNDYQTLIADVAPGTSIILLDPNREAFGQMADALSGMSNLDSIQVVSHGGQGHLYIAGRVYWAEGLENRTAELQAIGAALRPGGDILFYACDVGAGEKGQGFANAIHRLTGADVAVSNDGTGGGDGKNWTLETHTGAIEASSPFSALSLATFSGSLQTRTVTLASGTTGTDKDAGSLNYQITNAADGDVIVFAESLKNATVSLGVTTSLLTVSGKGITLNGDVNGDGIADVILSGKGDSSATSTTADYRGLAFNATDKTSTVKNLIFERFYGSTALQGAVTLQGGSLVVDGAIFRNNLNNAVTATANSIDLTVKNSIFHHNSGVVTGIGAFSAIRSFGSGSLAVENTVVADNTYTMNCGSNSPTYPGGIISHIRTTAGAATVNIRNNTIINNTVINNDAQATNIKTAAIGIYSQSSGAVANIYNNIIIGNSGSNGGTAFADANSINYNSDSVTLNSDKNHFGSSETATAKFVDATNSNLALRDYRPHADATDFINKGNSSDANYYGGSYDIRGIDRIRDGLLDLGAYEVRWNAGAPDLDLGGAGKNTAVSSTDPSAGVTVAASAVTSQTDSDTRLLGATITLTGIADTGKESLSLDAASARAYGIAGTLSNSDTTLTLTGAASLADYQAVLRLVQYKNTETAFTDGARTVTFTVHDGETASTARTSTITLGTPVAGPTVTGVTSSTANGSYKVGDTVSVQVTFSESVDVTGTPQLTLETGTTDRAVNYVSGSGTATLTFTYTVQAGDTSADLDYQATTALALNGGAIVASSGGAAASLTLAAPGATNSLGANKAIVIDTTAPTASVTAATVKNTGDVTTAQGSETGTVYLVKSGATVTDKASLDALAAGNTANSASIATANTDTTISAAGLEDGTYYVYVVDAVGNVSAASSSAVTIDSTAPMLAASDTANVAENAATVKTVSATDASTIAYSIVAGNDGAKFSIDASTGALTFTAAPDYETPTDVGGTAGDNVYIVTVRATDAAGNTADQTLTVTVANVNEAPTATDDTGAAMEKGGTANGSGGSNATGAVLTNDADPDSGATLTVTAVRTGAVEGSGTAGTVGQSLTGTYGSLTLNADGSYTYVVDESNAAVQGLKAGGALTDSFNYTVSDGALTDIAALAITINGAYDAPTDVSLSANGVSTYDNGTNVTVGTLSTTDVDSSDTFTYAIVSAADPSSNDVTADNLFNINGADLRAANPSALTQGTYTLVVRVTDGGNLTYDKTLTVTVSDTLIVTTDSDSGDDAETDATYAAAVGDGGGLSLREALFLAQAGGKTIGFAAGLDGLTITLGSDADVAAGTTFLLANSSLTIAAQKLNLAGGFSVNAGSGYALTINSTLGDAGSGVTSNLTKSGAGTLVLGGTNNTADTGLSSVTVSAGTLSVAGDGNLSFGDANDPVSVTLSGGGTLKATGTGSFTINNKINLGTGGGTIEYANTGASDNLRLTGQISGGDLTKTGAGLVSLDSALNSYAATTVSAGVLGITEDHNLGSDPVTLNGGSLRGYEGDTINNAIIIGVSGGGIILDADHTFSGEFSGSGLLTVTGSASTTKLTLSNTGNEAAFSGGVTVAAGTLSIAADENLGSGTVTLASGTTLKATGATDINNAVTLTGGATISNSAAVTVSGAVTGAFTLTKAEAGTLTLSSASNNYGAVTVSTGGLSVAGDNNLGSGTVTLAAGTTLTVTGATDIDNAVTLTGAATINTGAATTISGAVTGAYTLTKAGSETLTLSNTGNNYGAVTVSTGGLSVAGDNNLGSGAVTLAAGTTLTVTGAADIDNAVTLTGDATIDNSAAATLSGVISGNTYTLTKAGTGTLTLNNVLNSGSSWKASVSTGTLSIGADSHIGSGAVTLNGGTLQLNNAGTVDNAITLGSSGGTVNVANGAGTLSGAISGFGPLTKTGEQTLSLSGNNTYTGGTTINGGALSVDVSGNLGSGALTMNGGTFDVTNSVTFAGAVIINGDVTFSAADAADQAFFTGAISNDAAHTITKTGSGAYWLSNANALTSAFALNGGALVAVGSGTFGSGVITMGANTALGVSGTGDRAIGNDIVLNGDAILYSGDTTYNATGSAVTFSGEISETGGARNLTLIVGTTPATATPPSQLIPNSSLTLSGNNSYSGSTNLTRGLLIAGHDNALGSSVGGTTISDGASLRIANGVTVADALSVTGAGISSGGVLQVTSGSGVVSGAVTMTGDATIGVSGTALSLSGAISGGFALTKNGDGALTLSASSTYSGLTTVSAGTLLVTGALSNTSGVSVSSGATLAGTGSIFASSSTNTLTVDAGGYLAPGTAGTAGRLTVNGNLVLNGTMKLDLAGATAGTGYDQVVVNGTATLGAASAFDVTYTASSGNNTFIVIDNNLADAVSGTLNGVAEGASLTSNSRQYKASYIGGSGNDVTLQDNSPPVFTVSASTSANEDSGYTYVATASDADGDTVTVTATTLPSWLSFSNGVLTGTPSQADVGTHSVVLTASDGKGGVTTQSFTITVASVNDAPVFTSTPPTSVSEKSTYSYTPTATDEEGQALTFAATTLPSWLKFENGVLTGTPGQADVGSHTVTLTATDASGAVTTQSFTVTVADVNDAPVFTSTPPTSVNEKSVYAYTPTATDAEGQALTFAATTLPSWLKFENGVLTGTPGQADVGSHAVTLTATDASGAKTTQSFTVTVADVNDAPVFTSTPPTSVNEKSTYSYTPTATDAEGQALSFAATTLPSWLKFENGVLTGTPGQADVGSHTVTLTATDASGAKTTQSFTVTVADVNDAPVFTSTPPTSVNEKSVYAYTPTATDAEGQALNFAATTLPPWLRFENGVLTGTPGQADVGTHTVTLTATDASGAKTTQSFTVAVADVNDAPVFASGQPGNATAGQAFSFGLSASDPDGGRISFSATGLPAWLSLTDNGNGTASLSGAPGSGDVGPVSVTVRVTDVGGAVTTQTLSFNVEASGAATLNLTQTTTTTTTTTNVSTASATTAASLTSSTSSSSSTATGGTGTNAGTGSTTVALVAGGSSAGGSSSGPGGTEVGRDSPATVRVGNVDGNASSATGIQQTQGLTSTVTSGDASASADGSTLVRNAARGDSAATSSFYGSGTILSLSSLNGGPSNGGPAGFGAGASSSFGAGSGFGASAGGLGGGVSAGGASAGGTSGAGQSGSGAGQPGQGGFQGRSGSDGANQQGQGAQRSVTTGSPTPSGQSGLGGAGQGASQIRPQNAAPQSPAPQNTTPLAPTPQNGQPGPSEGAPSSGEGPAPAPNPGPQTGLDSGMRGLLRAQWAADAQTGAPAPLPGRGVSEQLAFGHSAFERQAARLSAAAAALTHAA